MFGMGSARPNTCTTNPSNLMAILSQLRPRAQPAKLALLPISRALQTTAPHSLIRPGSRHSFSHLSKVLGHGTPQTRLHQGRPTASSSLLSRRPQLNGTASILIQRRGLSCFGKRAASHEQQAGASRAASSPAGTGYTYHPGQWTSYYDNTYSYQQQQEHQHKHHHGYSGYNPKYRTEGRWQRRWRTRHACGLHGLLDFGRIRPEFFWGRLEKYHKGLYAHKHSERHVRKNARHHARSRGHCRRASPDEYIYQSQQWIRAHRARDNARNSGRGLIYFSVSHLPRGTAPRTRAATVLPRLWQKSLATDDDSSQQHPKYYHHPSRAWSEPAAASPARWFSARPTLTPLLSHLGSPGAHAVRAFSSTPSREFLCGPPLGVLQAGIPILLPLMTVLKSSAALNVIGVASRVALTLLPLSLRGKFVYAIRERYAREPNPSAWLTKMASCVSEGTANSSAFLRFNAVFLAPALALLPIILLGAILLASLERTPVTGRVRVLMVSPAEEAELVQQILATGETASGAGSARRDWVQILRTALEMADEGVSPVTGRRMLLGGEVLDERDWRVRWTKSVLGALQAGVPTLAREGATTTLAADGHDILHAPPSLYPLKSRATSQSAAELGWKGELLLAKHGDGKREPSLLADYELIVIDRAESNSFAFGFGPDEIDGSPDSRGTRGVIVVYTGFIDEILGRSPQPQPAPAQAAHSSSFLGGLFPSTRAKPPQQELPNLVPDVMPTAEQTKSLAVLLSHELAHLVLSHTLESYASTALLIPHLSKLTSDVLRTILFPVTAILGPFFNDAIGRSMNEGALGSWGCLGQAVNSCESRKLETEADLVALRLLANSGIDPRIALDFWAQRVDNESAGGSPTGHSHAGLRPHSAGKGEQGASAFMRTHPVNEERVSAIRNELTEWARLQRISLA